MSRIPKEIELPKEIEERVQHILPRDLLHDLRTPLGAILGYSELMIEQMKEKGDEEFVPYLERISLAGHKLLEMMTDNFQSPPRDISSGSKPEANNAGQAEQ